MTVIINLVSDDQENGDQQENMTSIRREDRSDRPALATDSNVSTFSLHSVLTVPSGPPISIHTSFVNTPGTSMNTDRSSNAHVTHSTNAATNDFAIPRDGHRTRNPKHNDSKVANFDNNLAALIVNPNVTLAHAASLTMLNSMKRTTSRRTIPRVVRALPKLHHLMGNRGAEYGNLAQLPMLSGMRRTTNRRTIHRAVRANLA